MEFILQFQFSFITIINHSIYFYHNCHIIISYDIIIVYLPSLLFNVKYVYDRHVLWVPQLRVIYSVGDKHEYSEGI